jgi:two-component system, cell cycle response regulator
MSESSAEGRIGLPILLGADLARCRFRAIDKLENLSRPTQPTNMTADRSLDTLVTSRKELLQSGASEACLVHIYPTGSAMGKRYPLGIAPLHLGRGEDNDIRIQDGSVSRRHAVVQPATDGYFVSDLGSTNGTFVNDVPADKPTIIRDRSYLRVGNCIYKFLTGGNIEADYHEEIYRLTITDGLTDISNHRYLVDFLDRELARSIRHERPLAVLMFDLDRFKSVNDTYGHLCGDYVLRELSQRIKKFIRREDLFARYGGEEFTIVLVETGMPMAIDAAERIRNTIADTPFKFDGVSLNLTVSLGVASTVGSEKDLSATEILKRADAHLYKAKQNGRNRVFHD